MVLKGYECVMRAVEFYICEYEETQPQLSRGELETEDVLF
jgi:hypothetical protein